MIRFFFLVIFFISLSTEKVLPRTATRKQKKTKTNTKLTRVFFWFDVVADVVDFSNDKMKKFVETNIIFEFVCCNDDDDYDDMYLMYTHKHTQKRGNFLCLI